MLQRWIRATRYSWQGLRAAYQHERAFREEAWLLIIAIPLALWIGDDGWQRVLLIASVLGLLIVELLNSAIEAVVDRISPEQHPLAARAKDMASAAVLLMLTLVILVWGGVLIG